MAPRRTGPPTIRPARPSEAVAIADVLTDAALRQRELEGSTGWPVPFPAGEVSSGIVSREWYVIEQEDRLLGAFRLVWEDPMFWGRQPPVAGYLHKLAVRRRAAGRGLGARAIDWAVARVRAEDRSYLRLDCLASNRRLVRYYGALGFRGVRDVRVGPPGRERLCRLMERAVSEGEPPPGPGPADSA